MKLVLFFTRGISLKIWLDKGLFDREKLIYEEHLKRGNLQKVYWITYGTKDGEIANELKHVGRLHKDIEILSMPKVFDSKFGKIVYSFLIPLIHRKILRQVDILKTNQMDGSWSAVITKWIYKKPLVVRTGYTWSQLEEKLNRKSQVVIWIIKLMEKFSYKYADVAIIASKHDKDYVTNNYNPKEIKVIYNYIDLGQFRPVITLKGYPNKVVYVGRLSNEKNLFNLIKAIAKLDLTLDIYGSRELEGELKKEAERLNAKVNFCGVIPNKDLPGVLNKYKYFILPSYFEGMPKSLLEAMACGLLCIGTNVEGINEVIEDGKTGILAYSTDAQALTEALKRAITLDDRTYTKISENARGLIEEKFSLPSCVEKEREIFEFLIRCKC